MVAHNLCSLLQFLFQFNSESLALRFGSRENYNGHILTFGFFSGLIASTNGNVFLGVSPKLVGPAVGLTDWKEQTVSSCHCN